LKSFIIQTLEVLPWIIIMILNYTGYIKRFKFPVFLGIDE